ncbi:ankyrin repeat-containing domain protein, partial [Elsinoe ampelina]
ALLFDHKADPAVKLINGSQPIHSAAARGSVGCIKALLEAGVDINVANMTGRTPLHWAVDRRAVDAVRFLLGDGAD